MKAGVAAVVQYVEKAAGTVGFRRAIFACSLWPTAIPPALPAAAELEMQACCCGNPEAPARWFIPLI